MGDQDSPAELGSGDHNDEGLRTAERELLRHGALRRCARIHIPLDFAPCRTLNGDMQFGGGCCVDFAADAEAAGVKLSV